MRKISKIRKKLEIAYALLEGQSEAIRGGFLGKDFLRIVCSRVSEAVILMDKFGVYPNPDVYAKFQIVRSKVCFGNNKVKNSDVYDLMILLFDILEDIK